MVHLFGVDVGAPAELVGSLDFVKLDRKEYWLSFL